MAPAQLGAWPTHTAHYSLNSCSFCSLSLHPPVEISLLPDPTFVFLWGSSRTALAAVWLPSLSQKMYTHLALEGFVPESAPFSFLSVCPGICTAPTCGAVSTEPHFCSQPLLSSQKLRNQTVGSQ